MQQLGEKNFEEATQGMAVIHFTAPWCKHGKEVAEHLQSLESEFSEIKFGEVNVDTQQSLASKYTVINIPTILIFKQGEEVERLVGNVPSLLLKNELAARISNHRSDEVLQG